MATLLEGTGLVHDYFWFPASTEGRSRLGPMMSLAKQIRAWKPDVLIYMHEQRGLKIAIRDAALFRLIGIRRVIGVPLTRELQRRAYNEQTELFEHRSEYLTRSLAELGDAKLALRSSWDLNISHAEHAQAAAAIDALSQCPGMLAMSIGTKADANDWGDANWRSLLKSLGGQLPGWGLVALGAPVEQERTSELLSSWAGPKLSLCGALSVRESGAVLQRASLFVGHDSGPMHLAAAVGTPCAAVFSARNLPGIWFPHGTDHKVFYKRTECAGCQLTTCVEFNKKCITSVTVEEVTISVMRMLERKHPQTQSQHVA
jgi:heptosyltransferase-3